MGYKDWELADLITQIAKSLEKEKREERAHLAWAAFNVNPRIYRLKWLIQKLYEADKAIAADSLAKFTGIRHELSERETIKFNEINATAKNVVKQKVNDNFKKNGPIINFLRLNLSVNILKELIVKIIEREEKKVKKGLSFQNAMIALKRRLKGDDAQARALLIYKEEGLAGVNEYMSKSFLDSKTRADIFTHLAKEALNNDSGKSAELARLAFVEDPNYERLRWLGLLFQLEDKSLVANEILGFVGDKIKYGSRDKEIYLNAKVIADSLWWLLPELFNLNMLNYSIEKINKEIQRLLKRKMLYESLLNFMIVYQKNDTKRYKKDFSLPDKDLLQNMDLKSIKSEIPIKLINAEKQLSDLDLSDGYSASSISLAYLELAKLYGKRDPKKARELILKSCCLNPISSVLKDASFLLSQIGANDEALYVLELIEQKIKFTGDEGKIKEFIKIAS